MNQIPSTTRQVKASVSGITYSSRNRSPSTNTSTHHRAKRETIETFSRKSKASFKALWRTIEFQDYLVPAPKQPAGQGFLLTMNCPPRSECMTHAGFKRLKDAFSKALLAHFGDNYQGAIWKAEKQESGLPHLHIVLFLAQRYQTVDLADWTRETWCRLTGDDIDTCRRRKGTDARTLHGTAGNPGLLKYLLKQPATGAQQWGLGRVWGQWSADRLPTSKPIKIKIPAGHDYQHEFLIQTLKQHPATRELSKVQKLSTKWKGFSLDGLTTEEISSFWVEFEKAINEAAANLANW